MENDQIVETAEDDEHEDSEEDEDDDDDDDEDEVCLSKSKIIFLEKSLSVRMSVCLSVCLSRLSRPVPSRPPKKVTETENFAKQRCQIYFKVEKKIFRVIAQNALQQEWGNFPFAN